MAYIASNQEEDPNKKRGVDTGGGAGAVGAPGASGMTSGVGGAAAAPAAGAPTGSSGNFTNLNEYLNTNKAGAEKLGTQVGSNISKEVNEAAGAINTGQQTFNQAATANTRAFDEAALKKTLESGQADDVVTAQLSGSYAGPKNFTDAGIRPGIDKELTEAQRAANLAGTVGGRIELLRGMAGAPQQAGVTRLNQLFVQGNETAAKSVADAAAGANPLAGQLTAAEQAAAVRAQEAAAANQAVREQTVGGITGYLTQQEQAAATRLAEQKAAAEAQQRYAREYLQQLSAQAPTNNGGAFSKPIVAGDTRGLVAGAGTPNDGSTGSMFSSSPVGRNNDRSPFSSLMSNKFGAGGSSAPAPESASTSSNDRSPIGAMNPFGSMLAQSAAPTETAQVQAAAPAPAPIPPGLLAGFEAAGLTQEQAQALQDQVIANQVAGGDKLDLAAYYSPEDLSRLSTANVTDAATAARLNALSQLAGGQARYNSADGLQTPGNLDFSGASNALQARRDQAIQQSQARAAAAEQQRILAEQGAAQQRAADAQVKAAKKTAAVTGVAGGAAAGFAVGGPIGAVVGGVIGAVFCFRTGTPVQMADGSLKNIEHIVIGDVVELGGVVMGGGMTLADQIYQINDSHVTPNHVFFDGGKWVVARDVGTPVELPNGIALVHPIVTEHNLVVAGGFVSTDMQQVPAWVDDRWNLMEEQRIEWLNAQTARNEIIMEFLCSSVE